MRSLVASGHEEAHPGEGVAVEALFAHAAGLLPAYHGTPAVATIGSAFEVPILGVGLSVRTSLARVPVAPLSQHAGFVGDAVHVSKGPVPYPRRRADAARPRQRFLTLPEFVGNFAVSGAFRGLVSVVHFSFRAPRLKSYPVAVGPGYAEVEVGVPDEAAPADAAALQSAHLVAGVVAVDVAVHATLRPQRAVASADAVLVLMTRGREGPPVTEPMLGAFSDWLSSGSPDERIQWVVFVVII